MATITPHSVQEVLDWLELEGFPAADFAASTTFPRSGSSIGCRNSSSGAVEMSLL
jgi:hypothetical protein